MLRVYWIPRLKRGMTRQRLKPCKTTSNSARANLMSILVTGGAGYIGSHMVHSLLESGERVVVLDNLSTGFKWAIPRGVALVIGESGDDAVVSRLIAEREVSAIIHFAA